MQACAEALNQRLPRENYDVLVTAEAKSIPLIHALASVAGKPYVVLRKTYKPYMGETLSAETVSITTGRMQNLYLDEKDRELLRGKRVVLLDDVISTGSTLDGMRKVMALAEADIAAEAAIFTEGEESDWEGIVSLGHLPLFRDD